MSHEQYRNTFPKDNTGDLLFVQSSYTRITDFILTGTKESIYHFYRFSTAHSSNGTPITLHYRLHDDVEIARKEEKILHDFVDAWNTFVGEVIAKTNTVLQILRDPLTTRKEAETSYNYSQPVLAEIEGIQFINTQNRLPGFQALSSTFDEYRSLIIETAAGSLGLNQNRTIQVVPPQSELSDDEVFTLNTLANLLLGKPIIGGCSEIYADLSETLKKDYHDLDGVDEFIDAVTQFPRRILAARNGLLLAEDHPEIAVKQQVKSKRKEALRSIASGSKAKRR